MSKHFKQSEFACACCKKCLINLNLCNAFEKLRSAIGDKSILINSGYRCEKHNKHVGGSPKSQHVLGNAADAFAPHVSLKELWLAAFTVKEFTGLGLYPDKNFIHVDIRPGPRKSWGFVGGKYVSAQEAFELL